MTHIISTLMKTRSPIVAVSVPGRQPLRFKRNIIVESLKGLTVTSTRIERDFLIVTAEGKRVHAVRKFQGGFISRLDAVKVCQGWAAGERCKRARAATLPKDKKLAARAKKITALYDKLQKLTRRPKNPAVAMAMGYKMPASNSILTWYQQKTLRHGKTKQELSEYWQKNQHLASIPTKKPWELITYESQTWGAARYEFLKSGDRQAVKAQLAVLLEVDEREISVFRRRLGI